MNSKILARGSNFLLNVSHAKTGGTNRILTPNANVTLLNTASVHHAPALRAERLVGFVQVQQLAHVHQQLKGEGVSCKMRTNAPSQLKRFS